MSPSPISIPPSSPIADDTTDDNVLQVRLSLALSFSHILSLSLTLSSVLPLSLQPFFVLHKALPQKCQRKAAGSTRTRRKIDLPHSSPKSPEKSDAVASSVGPNDANHERLRLEAFNMTWSKIDTTIKTADMSVLSSWYCEPENYDHPVIIVIDDMERCSGAILADFIRLLSLFVLDARFSLLSGKTHTARYIPVRRLTEEEEEKKKKKKKKRRRSTSRGPSSDSARGSPTSRCCPRCPSTVAARGFFLPTRERVRGDKFSCFELLEAHNRGKDCKNSRDDLGEGLSDLRKLLKAWSSVILNNKIQLLDIFCEATDPALSSLDPSNHKLERELPLSSLIELLDLWSIHTEELYEVHGEVRELQSVVKSSNSGNNLKERQIDCHK
ncbi:hypothetical protein GW17_00019542 [Ensete ventricosum]|nr:hypothetical protein GW17_00019542 [Ensete ventricosum]